MRTRWEEVEDSEAGSSRVLGFGAATWAIAVPVAFIAGAAVMSYFDQSRVDPSLTIPPPVAGEQQRPAPENRSAAQPAKWEEQAREAAAKAAELQMQVEALRDQVSDEARRREQAEQTASRQATTLKQMEQAAASQQARQVAVSAPPSQPQNSLPYAASATLSAPLLAPETVSAPPSTQSNDDSMALQRIIEDTASRSAALSDRDDEGEAAAGTATQAAAQRMPRRSGDVEAALSKATGLDQLSASQRSGLKDELVSGACVTVSLESVFGNPVPVVPLRNLVRDLDSDC